MAEDLPGEPHVADQLGPYYLNCSNDAGAARIEPHLATCPACRACARHTVETIAALESLTSGERAELAGVLSPGRPDGGLLTGPTI